MDETLVIEKDFSSDIERLLKERGFIAHLQKEFKEIWLAEEGALLRSTGVPEPLVSAILKRCEACVTSAIIAGVSLASDATHRMMNGDTVSLAMIVAIREELDKERSKLRANAALYKASEASKG